MESDSLRCTSLATLWLLAACNPEGAEGPSHFDAGDRGPAVLAFYGDTTAVELAAATRVGQATTVRFTSFAADLRLDHNEVEVRFAKVGRARVRIVGLARPGDRPFVLERDIEVTP